MAFSKTNAIYACCCSIDRQVKRADMAAVMQDLGADWDRDELADALEGLDPSKSGFVHMQDFVRWWSN